MYRGGAFNGNHVHAALKPTVVTALKDVPVTCTIMKERSPALEAKEVSNRYYKSAAVIAEDIAPLKVLFRDFMA